MIDFTLKELKDIQYALDQSAIVAITNHKGEITYVNEQFCEISKYERDELIGQNHRILNSGLHSKHYFQQMWRTISSGQVWQGDLCNCAKDGSLYWVQTTIVPFLDENQRPYQYVSIRVDITEQKSVEKMQRMAFYDSLTGLPNKRKLVKRLGEAVIQAKIEQNSFGILYMDLDGFKRINDSFGHRIGDLFLIEVANRLRAVMEKEKSVFRLNGDEFIIFFDYYNEFSTQQIIKKIICTFEKAFVIEEYEFYSSISIGVSYSEDVETTDELLSRADMAMLEAKKVSGTAYLFFNKSMYDDIQDTLLIENKLRKAIENDELQLYYQPQIDSHTGEITGVEALIRWFDDELGYMPPNKFIPIAEERGFIDIIGEWTLVTACQQIKQWNKQYDKELSVAVNISPTHFLQSSFVHKVRNILSYTEVNSKYLQIEITEDSMMQYTKESIQMLADLKKLGVQIAIDDFGTGYSSFNYLRQFPIDTIKIDRSFIADIMNSKSAASIVEVMIKLGHALQLKVVAEGVEQAEEQELLKSWKCDLIQGFYYSKPLSVQEFSNKLEALKAPKQ